MEFPPNENSKTMIVAQQGKELMQELKKGQKITAEVGLLLKKSPADQDLEQAKSLMEKVGLCFSNALSIIKSAAGRDPSDALLESLHFGTRGMKDSGDRKRVPATKDRRGCYKRRRTSEMEATVTANPFNDGHSWRKYGQKDILGSNYPRSYFRCTHKHDQHCQAIKQVQQTEENPSMYRVTYMGQHTCRDPLKASQLFMDASSPKEPFMLRFESRLSAECNSMLLSSSEPIKQEINEDMPSDLAQMSSPSSGYIFPSDFPPIGSCGPTLPAFSMGGSDLTGDVASAGGYSCSSTSFAMMDTADFAFLEDFS